jgi:molybdate transport system permease protein
VTRSRVPLSLAGPAALGLALVALPLAGLLVRSPWHRLPELLTQPAVRQTLLLSLRCSLAAVLLSLLLGVPLAWLLARAPLPARRLVRAVVTVPLVLPPVVGGIALLLAFGRHGLLGSVLVAAGATPAFTSYGVVLAEAFVALPFLVLTVESGIAGLDQRHEQIAATLGARPLRVFLTVTLPLVLPSVTAGAALAWARALGEFGATITFAGSLPGSTQTVPLAAYALLQDDPPAAYALSLLLLAVSVLLVVAVQPRRR